MIPTLLTDSVTSDLERAVHYALLWGLEAVELRTVGGPMDRVPHVNERKIRRRLLESKLPLLAVVPGLFEGDIADRAGWLNELAILEETLQFCRRLECPRVVVSGFSGSATEESFEAAADVLRRGAERASKANVTLCVLNTVGGMVSTGALMARLLEAVGNRAVAAAWDPVGALISGENSEEGLDAVAAHTSLVRCRNVELAGNGWEPRSIDRGAVEWSHQLKRLSEVGFEGPVSLEIAVEPKSKSGLHDASTLIQLIRKAST